MTFTMTNRTARRVLPGAVALASLALATACGGSSSTAGKPGAGPGAPNAASASATGASAHNAADVAFATDMIPHHAQAVQMADMALVKATDPEVKTLAAAIKGAQDPEIETMTGWLTDWNAPLPMTGMSMSSGNSMGMMSAGDMAQLDKATGPMFDKIWVQMMTAHHQGALTMAKSELANGQFADAKALAQRIITSQSAEITKMAAIAKRLG